MTPEERFARIEHVTAALVEDRKKDREEYRARWRDTQRRMGEFASGMVDLRRQVSELAVETRLRIEEIAAESRAADARLESRIDTLVSALGEFMADAHRRLSRLENQQ